MSGAPTEVSLFDPQPITSIPLVSWWGHCIGLARSSTAADANPEVGHKPGAGAELAALKALALRHESRADWDQAAQCWNELAQGYAQKKSRYDAAIAHGQRALSIKQSAALREEIARWLEGAGFWTQAAQMLVANGEPKLGVDRARWHRRLASLWWRAGELEQAAQALADVARVDAECTEPLELLAGLHSNAPQLVSSERAVLAQLEAARRFQQRGARLAAFEAELRAFEIDPSSVLATEQLAISLGKLGRREAADDIWRVCAKLTADKSLHHAQLEKALGRDEFDRALGAGLDAMSDTALSVHSSAQAVEFSLQPYGTTPRSFDGILARARLLGWLAARLEMALIESRSREQAKAWILLTRVYASAIGKPELAVQSLARALVVEPTSPELRRMLEAFSDDGRSNAVRTPLVDALRVGVSPEVRARLASEFLALASEDVAAPVSLVAWAVQVLEQEPVLCSGQPSAVDWQELKRIQRREVLDVMDRVALLTDDEVLAALQQVASVVSLDPEALVEERDVLLRLHQRVPDSATVLQRLAQLIEVFSWNLASEPLPRAWQEVLDVLASSPNDTGITAAASFWLRQGSPDRALHVLRRALDRAEPSERLLGWVVTLARRTSDLRLYADGLSLMAKTSEPTIAAMLLAHAADAYVETADRDAARRAVDAGLALAPDSARLVSTDVRLQELEDPRSLAETLERALGVIPPRAQFAFLLADAHQKLGNSQLALAWALRASTLQPAAAALRERVAELAIAAGDPMRLTEWLLRSLDVPAPISTWLPMGVRVIDALVSIDPPRAAEVVRRLLAATGAADSAWRVSLLKAADAVGDAQLALDILERAVASGNDAPELLREIVRRRLQLGDFEAAYESALRAIRLGADRSEVRDWVPALSETDCYQVAETELAAAELNWELTRHGTDAELIVRAMRRLAKDRLVLARDDAGACEIWSALLSMPQTDVLDIVATDLVPSLGNTASIERLSEWAASAREPKLQAAYFVAIAFLYAQVEDIASSRQFVQRALERDAANVDALFVAESQLGQVDDGGWLDDVYEVAERATYGQHGARALHYRAAKVLESKGDHQRALRHACAAFTALPSAGAAFRLMSSLSRAVSDAQPFVDAVWTVACSGGAPRGARWIDQAIEELERSESFVAARFELLLRALMLDASVSVVQKAAEAASRLSERSHGDGEVASLRLAKALRTKLDAAKGPQGARLALAVAAIAVTLSDLELCAQGLQRAFECDADVDEYAEAEVTVQRLATEPARVKLLLEALLAELDKPYINVGFEALKVLGWLQLAGGDSDTLQTLNQLVTRLGKREPFLAWVSDALERTASGSIGSGAVLQELVQVRLHEHRLDDAVQLLFSIVSSNQRTQLAYESARQGIALLGEHRDRAAAMQWLQSIREHLTPLHAATLELELARQAGEGLPLVHALAHVAYGDPSSPAQGMAYLQEATALADRLGFCNEALECARSAVAWDPNDAGAQLQLATILYKLRDRDGDDHAEEIVSALRNLPVQNHPEQEELRAFLLSEALDAAYGTGTGTDELLRAHAHFGNRPLLALGIAERLVLSGDDNSAIPLFDVAINGDLRGLRTLATVCLEGARVARNQHQLAVALRWLQKAIGEANCPSAARELSARVQAELDESRKTEVADSDEDRANVSAPSNVPNPSDAAASLSTASLEEEPVEIPLVRRRTEKPPSTPRPGVGATSGTLGHDPQNDPDSLDEAVERARVMMHRASPSYQTLTVLRRWLRRWPGSTELMAHVRDAAFVERDIPLSRAVEHARGVLLGAAERIEPPELGAQPIVPEAVQLLLARDLGTPVGEAIAMLWEGAEHLVQKDLLDYGVTGLDRVVPNASNALWQVASELAPRLDLLKVPLFHRKSAEPVTARVALSSPTAVVLQGELPKNLRDLTGLVGASLWITQPEYSLLTSAPAEYVKMLLLALQLAFGPPQRHPMTNMSESLRLAEKLWECIPSSAQRHLRELCLDSFDYALAREYARLAQRRAGLYATGDLHWSLAELSRSEALDVLNIANDPKLTEQQPAVADLLRLATSAEYAAVRWQPSRGSERRMDVLQR